MKLNKILLFIFLTNASLVFAREDFSWSGNLYKNIRKYNSIHKKFFKKVCSPGTEFKYYKLLRKYRGQGRYLPLVKDDIDREAIKSNLAHFKKKITYIKKMYKKLKKKKKIPNFNLVSKDLEETLKNLLSYKQAYYAEISKNKKIEILHKSEKGLRLLERQFDTFLKTVFFLKSYNFPNDHLANRTLYEKYKVLDTVAGKKKANKVFFYRKIVEDGTYNKKHQRPDLYTRSTLDTLYFKIKKQKIFISENVRYDLDWIFRNVKRVLKEGHKRHLAKLREWEKRTKENLKFYSNIIKQKNKRKAHTLIKNKNEATIKLKKFVYSKQAETYEFWHKQKTIWKSLFSLETILYNEVGIIDGKDALERKDVAQIVMNRYLDPFYSSLDMEQEIAKYLTLKESVVEDEKWLNTLFRVGEFSFTYHYIAASVKIFCPDMSRRGRKIRSKNLKISLKALKNFKKDYHALRYFSRISMLGKIDMSSVWSDYEKIPEKPGYELLNQKQKKLERSFHAQSYQFLYNFKDPKGVSYQVLEINDKTYSMTWVRGRPRFYRFRNPHLFTYFKKK